jgi:glycerophosphoryl diester phosphodiesterase
LGRSSGSRHRGGKQPAADAAKADIIHLCWERGGERPHDLVTRGLLDRARHAGREIVLWHEERPALIPDLVHLPVLGISSDERSRSGALSSLTSWC